MNPSPIRSLPRLRRPSLLAALALLAAAGAGVAPAGAASNLLAFTQGAAQRQGPFEAAGVAWTCGGELCSAKGPDDNALWPGLCAAFVREAGAVAAFGSVQSRFDAAALARCNETGAAARTPPVSPPPAEAPAALPPVANPPAESVGERPVAGTPKPSPKIPEDSGGEICNGRDDDGDGAVDEGVRMRVWEDRDRDLFGDSRRSREICPHELTPGLVVNDYDCDDGDPKKSPARDSCG